jgi:hypothetical protein
MTAPPRPNRLPAGTIDILRDIALLCLTAGYTIDGAALLLKEQFAAVQEGWGGESFRQGVIQAFESKIKDAETYGFHDRAVSVTAVMKVFNPNCLSGEDGGGDRYAWGRMPPTVRLAVMRAALGSLAAEGKIVAHNTSAGLRFGKPEVAS